MHLIGSESPLVEYRGQASDFDDLMKVKIHRFAALDDLDFDLSAPGTLHSCRLSLFASLGLHARPWR